MKLIIGGAYQGKRQYAIENFGGENIIADFHLTVLKLIKNGNDPLEYVKKNMQNYKDRVIICDDISCGVVPTDPLMRKWREAVGQVLAYIAKECEEVVRVFCGLGTRIK